MRPIVADVAWPVRLYVGHNVSPTKTPEPIDAGPKNPCIVWGPDPRLEGAFVDTLVQTCRESACSVYSTSFAAAMRPVAASTAETCCYCYQLVFVNIIYQYCNIIRVSCSLKKTSIVA